jgi:hypothetical protein
MDLNYLGGDKEAEVRSWPRRWSWVVLKGTGFGYKYRLEIPLGSLFFFISSIQFNLLLNLARQASNLQIKPNHFPITALHRTNPSRCNSHSQSWPFPSSL